MAGVWTQNLSHARKVPTTGLIGCLCLHIKVLLSGRGDSLSLLQHRHALCAVSVQRLLDDLDADPEMFWTFRLFLLRGQFQNSRFCKITLRHFELSASPYTSGREATEGYDLISKLQEIKYFWLLNSVKSGSWWVQLLNSGKAHVVSILVTKF